MRHEIKLTPKQLKDLQKRGLLKDSEGQPIPRLAPRFIRPKQRETVCPSGAVSVQPAGTSRDGSGGCGTVYGHIFFWSGGFGGNVPEGYRCGCGKTRAHYAKCPTCGHEKLEAVSV